ncbi:MAG: septum site-determining protein MinC [Pseudomonadota bacterium]|nr:septum site-determining protein MinC [Pseudomonadota bacterium]
MTQKKALEFKGRMLSLTRARILDPDLSAIATQLKDFARQMPQAVKGMPVVIEADAPLNLTELIAAMREVGLQPLGVVDGPLTESAQRLGIAVLPAEAAGRTARAQGSASAPAAETAAVVEAPVAEARRSTRIITEPVRSGQQIYAPDTDLIVLNTVSAGAEIAADGCVHVYGTLNGRAIAGARGDQTARIFCRKFKSELVAVAGVYAVAEQMQGELRNHSVQVSLVDGKLVFNKLDIA